MADYTKEITKIKLPAGDRLKLIFLAIAGCVFTIMLLVFFKDKSPVIDGVTTFLSLLGMYLTVKRAIEQWVIWIAVNGLSLIMWLNLIIHGVKAYSTVVMWAVYFILAVYFYLSWKKELQE